MSTLTEAIEKQLSESRTARRRREDAWIAEQFQPDATYEALLATKAEDPVAWKAASRDSIAERVLNVYAVARDIAIKQGTYDPTATTEGE